MHIVSVATTSFSVLTIIAQVCILLLLFVWLFHTHFSRIILRFFAKNALLIAFLIALTSTLGSLFYSEIAFFTPCNLCWYQRILMYPQTVLFAVAFARKDKQVSLYAIILSSLGAGLALYHYFLQLGIINELVPCSAVSAIVSCSNKFVMNFGYITIPMMSFSAFVLILTVMLSMRKFYRLK
jgi:disulfide bond formation protein DsbB